jgi:hypothetical protein
MTTCGRYLSGSHSATEASDVASDIRPAGPLDVVEILAAALALQVDLVVRVESAYPFVVHVEPAQQRLAGRDYWHDELQGRGLPLAIDCGAQDKGSTEQMSGMAHLPGGTHAVELGQKLVTVAIAGWPRRQDPNG